ncbi:hypothetical protein FSP39_006148 [Pinctada imbricata]|uniref:Fibronectin type-III domain-containing protein n=1 Tax=Pinctada imbricata TaxID=66713 RepID=A0AA89C5D2_PINIB|nr:hypothetical protein FSP39_006148 [Pinctada imbricata]
MYQSSVDGTDDAIRYEWSIGIEGMPEGEGIFDIKIEPVWYDVGLDKNLTICTNQKLPLQHGYSYVVYVRQWVSQTTYTQFASAGILVDYTPPLVRKGKFVKESIDSCLNDIEFSTENTTLTACWKGVFSDQQSGILHYFVSLGTIPEGDDVMKSENIGLLETKRWTGLSLNQGTKYFVTVMAVNNIGLSTSSYSDGVVIDFEKPVNGVVFNTIYHRNIPAQAADKVIGSSWHGFNDRHSFIKEYLVALFECDGQSNLTSLRYVNVGLKTKHQFKGAPLKHNRNYCIAVKAIDAAGFESNVSLSTPLLIDKTPPKGIKCTSYEVTDFAFIERQIHDQGLELIGPISFKKDEFLKFKINLDHTAPEICCGDIAFTYKETENTTMTSVSMKWAVIDAESGLDFCILTLGIPCTIEKLLGVEYKIVWDNTFMKEEDLVYTVNIGTAEGNADLIQNKRSTETHAILDIENTDEIFVAIEAKSETGLTCNYRKMMKIDV